MKANIVTRKFHLGERKIRRLGYQLTYPKVSDMRYQTNQSYVFLRVLFTKGNDRFGSLYIPWLDTLNRIEMINPVCVEHHKVAWRYAPDKFDCDGYIFRDGDKVYHNQYPRADYGQLDDSENWKLRVVPKDSEKVTKEEVEEFWDPWLDAFVYLRRLHRETLQNKMGASDEQRAMLKAHLDEVVNMVEKVTGKKVVWKQRYFLPKEGETELKPIKDWFSPQLVDGELEAEVAAAAAENVAACDG